MLRLYESPLSGFTAFCINWRGLNFQTTKVYSNLFKVPFPSSHLLHWWDAYMILCSRGGKQLLTVIYSQETTVAQWRSASVIKYLSFCVMCTVVFYYRWSFHSLLTKGLFWSHDWAINHNDQGDWVIINILFINSDHCSWLMMWTAVGDWLPVGIISLRGLQHE